MRYKNICRLLSCIFCFMILIGTQSCDDMSKLSDRFLDDGSIVYAAKVDSVAAHPGDGRIVLELFIYTQRIDSVRIYWNDGADSQSIYIGNKPGKYDASLEVEEAAYVFNLVSVDKYGNKSLPVEVSSEAAGDDFRRLVTRQQLTSAKFNAAGGKLMLYWGTPVAYGYENEIVYTNTEGKEARKRVSTTLDSITDWGSNLKYRTLALPNELAIDTFYTEYEVIQRFPIDKNFCKILGYSSQVNNGKDNVAANAFNDIYTDRWHSGDTGYPHWMTIDFGGEVDIRSFGVTPSTYDLSGGEIVDVRFPTKVRFEVSLDNVNWTSLGDYPSLNTQPGEQVFDVATTKVRYYRFTGIESIAGNGYMVLSELDAYLY